ncbi:MAG: dephospho-CoA kinase [Firmicutes bacterium]|nr:dephospho-CoA kinase [Bacillota bacterium]
MKIIGLTGGIGTGKSTVSAYLKEKGCVILDADKMSRQLTAPGGDALPAIRRTFGDEVFYDDGTLDRKKLGSIVFNDADKLKALEEITTQKVVEQTIDGLVRLRKASYNGIVIIDAPLLFECGMQVLAEENWLVTAGLEVRIERIIKRDGLDRQSILDRINNQMNDEEKMTMADYVIDNSGNLESLYQQIDKLIERVKTVNNE